MRPRVVNQILDDIYVGLEREDVNENVRQQVYAYIHTALEAQIKLNEQAKATYKEAVSLSSQVIALAGQVPDNLPNGMQELLTRLPQALETESRVYTNVANEAKAQLVQNPLAQKLGQEAQTPVAPAANRKVR